MIGQFRFIPAISGLFLLAACAPCPTVEVPAPVLVPGPVQYVPLPADLTADCGGAPELHDGKTGGELIEAARAWRARARCRDAQIESVRRLQGQ